MADIPDAAQRTMNEPSGFKCARGGKNGTAINTEKYMKWSAWPNITNLLFLPLSHNMHVGSSRPVSRPRIECEQHSRTLHF